MRQEIEDVHSHVNTALPAGGRPGAYLNIHPHPLTERGIVKGRFAVLSKRVSVKVVPDRIASEKDGNNLGSN